MVGDFAGDELAGERGLDGTLKESFQRTRAIDGIVAFAGKVFLGGIGQVEGDVAVGEAGAQDRELQFHDLFDVGERERLEEDGVVHAVQEFGAEVRAQFGHDFAPDAFLDFAGLAGVLDQQRAADVRGHDDDGVAEVHGAALAVGETAVVEDLQEDVENVVVGLLDLVEENHAVGPAADGFGKLAAFLVTDVAGRRADEPGHGVFLHVFAHVDADDVFLAVEERFGEGAGQLGFADTGGAEENE